VRLILQPPTTNPIRRVVTWRVLGGVLSSLLFLAALAWLLWKNVGDWPTLLRSFDPRFLGLAFVAQSAALGFAALTWHRMLASLGRDIDPSRNVGIYVTTAFARRLPGSYWGPAFRMFWYKRLGGDWRAAGAASVLEVWAVSVSGIVLAIIGIVLFVGLASEELWVSATVALILFGATCVPRVNRWLFRRLLAIVRPNGTTGLEVLPDLSELTGWVGLELVNWLLGGLELAAIIRALNQYDLNLIPGIVSVWAIAGTAGALITFLPGGFGVVEILLISLLGLWFPTSTTVLAALGLRLFTTACELVWMILGFIGTAILLPRRTRAS
jgi:glycosyltransferase 2 family protein